MLRVYLNGSEVDLYQDESVNLTLQFADIQNINAAAGSYSQTFRIPATQNNLGIVGQVASTTAVGVNLKTRIPAELVDNTIPILRGFCQVKQVYLQKEKYADIELVFFGGAVDLKTAIGDGMLSDLDLSSYNHTLNNTSILASWAGTLFSGQIRYGLIDKGFNWEVPGNAPWTPSDGLWHGELTPFVRAKTILDAIMDEAGFTYDSTFLDSAGSEADFDDLYLPAYNGSQIPIGSAAYNNNAIAALAADYTAESASVQTLPLVDTVTGGQDEGATGALPNGNWSNSPTYRYTAPYTGIYQIEVVYSYDEVDNSNEIELYVFKNGFLFVTLNTTALYAYNRTRTINAVLESGDTISLRGRIHQTGHGHTIEGNNTFGTGVYTGMKITAGFPFTGYSVDVAANMPKLKQIDFLLGLQKMFNLVFVPDKNKPNHLLIEPFTDYTSTGTAKDWSDKVDYSKDVTIQPTTDLQKKEYQWTHKQGKDFISDAIEKSLDRTYGRYRVTDPSNDFATGEHKVETFTAPYITSLIPGSAFPIYRCLQADGSGIQDPLPVFAYWHYLTDNFGEWFLRGNTGSTGSAGSFFPSFSNYSTDAPALNQKDLNFGMESAFFPIASNPINTLYFEYWAQYVKELYSEEARIMKCTMRLSKGDLAAFEFSDRIYIRDSYWRVLKLSYDANVEGVCQVELIKELSDVTVCADTPTGYDDRYNFILFNSSTSGSPDFGSEECCKLYGYDWVTIPVGVPGGTSPMGICKPKNQTTQPS